MGLFLISCQSKVDTPPVATGPVVDSVASADDVLIPCEVGGKGEPTLVFVDGWSCDRTYWREQVDEFSKTYQVVTVDMGGHGGSETGREDWTLASFGADVAAVVNKVNPNKVVLIGHSMAGSVNMEAAILLPGRVLGLIGADTYQGFGMGYTEEEVAGIMDPFSVDFASAMAGFVQGMFPESADSGLVDWVVKDMSAAPPEVAISAAVNFFRSKSVERLKEINVPIFAINSDMWPTALESNRKHATSFELKLMQNVGHFVQLEDPATFNRILHETLDELTGKSGASAGQK